MCVSVCASAKFSLEENKSLRIWCKKKKEEDDEDDDDDKEREEETGKYARD